MNINLSLSILKTYKLFNRNRAYSINRLDSVMPCDTVSFKCNQEIYRAITSDEELDALINGETGGKYATENPNGWRGDFPGKYFITFKPEFINSEKVVYDEYDKKYRLRNFTLDDIKDIRLGHNISGKIIYNSTMSDEEKREFVQNRINSLLNVIKKSNCGNSPYYCLSHYLRDYIPLVTGAYGRIPEVDEVKNCDFSDIEKFLKHDFIYSIKNENVLPLNITESCKIRYLFELTNDKNCQELINKLKPNEEALRDELSKKEANSTLTAQEKGALNTLRMLEKYDNGLIDRSYLTSSTYEDKSSLDDDDDIF